MAQCACGKLWDYVTVDGFGNVSTDDADIQMDGNIPIHVPFGGGANTKRRCGQTVTIIRMTSGQSERYFNWAFLDWGRGGSNG